MNKHQSISEQELRELHEQSGLQYITNEGDPPEPDMHAALALAQAAGDQQAIEMFQRIIARREKGPQQ